MKCAAFATLPESQFPNPSCQFDEAARTTPMQLHTLSRRHFLKRSAAAAAAMALPSLVPSTVFGRSAPSNRINLAAIGCGSRGTGNCGFCFLPLEDVRFVAALRLPPEPPRSLRPDGQRALPGESLHRLWRLPRRRWPARTLTAWSSARRTTGTCRWPCMRPGRAKTCTWKNPWEWPWPGRGNFAKKRPSTRSSSSTARSSGATRSSSAARASWCATATLGEIQRVDAWAPDMSCAVRARPRFRLTARRSRSSVPADLDYEMWIGPAPMKPYTADRTTCRRGLPHLRLCPGVHRRLGCASAGHRPMGPRRGPQRAGPLPGNRQDPAQGQPVGQHRIVGRALRVCQRRENALHGPSRAPSRWSRHITPRGPTTAQPFSAPRDGSASIVRPSTPTANRCKRRKIKSGEKHLTQSHVAGPELHRLHQEPQADNQPAGVGHSLRHDQPPERSLHPPGASDPMGPAEGADRQRRRSDEAARSAAAGALDAGMTANDHTGRIRRFAGAD